MNVSVIIPVFRAEGFIRKAVESALYHNEVKEIILIEDGSPDKSYQVCKTLANGNNRVHLFQHPQGVNKGVCASRNLGIEKATQEYICFLDADDFMTKSRFEKELEIFSENPNADGVYGALGTIYYDEIGAKSWENLGFDKNHLTTVNKPILPEHLFDYLIGFKNRAGYTGYFSIDTLTLKRTNLTNSKVKFDENLIVHEDSVFIWQCAYYLKLYTGDYLNPIAIRGVHKNNTITKRQNFNKSVSKQYKSLIDWSIKAQLNKKYQFIFKVNYFLYKYKALSGMRNVFRFFYKILFNK